MVSIKRVYEDEIAIYYNKKLIWGIGDIREKLWECRTPRDVREMVWGILQEYKQKRKKTKYLFSETEEIDFVEQVASVLCTDYDVKDTPMVFSDCKISDNEFEFCIDGELVGWEIPKIPTTATKYDVQHFVIGEIFCPMVGKIPFSPYEENQVIDYLTDAFCDHYGIDKEE